MCPRRRLIIIVFKKHERPTITAHDHWIGPKPTLWWMQGRNFAGEPLARRHSTRDREKPMIAVNIQQILYPDNQIRHCAYAKNSSIWPIARGTIKPPRISRSFRFWAYASRSMLVDSPQAASNERYRLPVKPVAVLQLVIRSSRWPIGAVDHLAPNEVIGQDLQDRAGERVTLIHLPESSGATAVFVIVAVMIRPNTVSRCRQNFPAETVDSEAKDYVQAVAFDRRDICLIEAVDLPLRIGTTSITLAPARSD